MAPWITPKRSLEMEYPEKLYVSLQKPDWPDEEPRTYFNSTQRIEDQAEINRDVEIAIYRLVGKAKLVNKTVLVEPDTP
jgi:hypothetical protein